MLVGLDVLKSHPKLARDWGACALLCNQASVSKNLENSWSVLASALGKNLVALFGPQHGFVSTVQDNMIESDHFTHEETGLPVYSLYSESREPSPKMLENADTILIDLQITGCRVYTYKYTMAACLRVAKKLNKRVVILDRPNPVGGIQLEGLCLDEKVKSFVGEFPIPMRHGLTMGEAAKLFNVKIGAELEVVELQEWNPEHVWSDFNRTWILPSPNLPMPNCVYTYPGTVLLEGTNLSEGRGTCLPFLFIGAPYIHDIKAFTQRVNELYELKDQSFFLRPTNFQPSFQKWSGKVCNGFQIHVLKSHELKSYRLGVSLIRAAIELSKGEFKWAEPGYEYNFKLEPIKMLVGDESCIEKFTASKFDMNSEYWTRGVEKYKKQVEPLLIYSRKMKI